MSQLIFPTQLFYNTSHLDKSIQIYLIEEPRYFTDFSFHKLKLAYHRASMKKYYDMLIKKIIKLNILNAIKYQNHGINHYIKIL